MSEHAFFGASALLFVASAAVTIVWCGSMSAMGGMSMPGGWTMSMAWMRMPDQTWPGAAASFLGMWIVMMVAMMLPSLVPILLRYRQAIGAARVAGSTRAAAATGAAGATGETSARHLGIGWMTAIAGAGYFFVWMVIGSIVFSLGIALAEWEMRDPAVSRAVPMAAGVVILIAGLVQFTPWKARQLECCREAGARDAALHAGAAGAWRHGLRLGVHCSCACAGPMLILLVLGVMDLGVMAIVTAAITAERFAPSARAAAHVLGVVSSAGGLLVMARAAGLV